MAWYKQNSGSITLNSSNRVYSFGGSIPENTVQYATVRFESAGTVSFYSTGSYDLVGYISTTDSFSDENGVPSSLPSGGYDDDSGDGSNFNITDFAVSAGTYYFWWKRFGGSELIGDWSVVIIFESSNGGGSGGDISEDTGDWSRHDMPSATISSSNPTIRTGATFSENKVVCLPVQVLSTGTYHFYSTGSVDLIGMIASSDAINSAGRAVNELAYNDDASGGDRNFDISDFSVNIVPGTWYFMWRTFDGSGASWADYDVYIEYVSGGGGGGGGSSDTWTDTLTDLGYIDEIYSNRISVGGTEYTVYKARFSDDGTIYFTSEGTSIDVRGYITTNYIDAYDPSTGEIDHAIDGGSSHGNFNLSADVTARQTYYFWIRADDPDDASGYIRFSIEPPEVLSEDWSYELWGSSHQISDEGSISFGRGEPAYRTLSCVPITFSSGGNYTISATSSQSLYGYLSTSESYDSYDGEPDRGVVGSDTSTSSGFSFDVSVSTDQQYYLWVRTRDGSAGTQSFVVEFAGGSGGGGGGGGSEIDGSWDIEPGSFGTVTSNKQETIYLENEVLYRYSVEFSASGTATFYSVGNFDTVGYLSFSSENSYDDGTGEPVLYQIRDDEGGSDHNFMFTYNVSANTTYLFWFRMFDPSDSGSVSICIQPPAGSSTDWTLDDFAYGTVRNRIDAYASLPSKTLAHRPMSFATAGVVTVYTTGNYDTIGYLSTSSDWNRSSGTPRNPTQFVDSGGDGRNFRFTFTASINTTYHLWYRTSDGSATGEFHFIVEPPGVASWDLRSFSIGEIGDGQYAKADMLSARTMWRFGFIPQSSGEYELYTTGTNVDTHGYLGTTSGFDDESGLPTSYIVEDDDGGDGSNCRIVRDLTAGTTYYFWVRPLTASGSGNTTVIIKPPEIQSTKGFWILTEDANHNKTWRKVAPYIFNGSEWIRATPCIFYEDRNESRWISGT